MPRLPPPDTVFNPVSGIIPPRGPTGGVGPPISVPTGNSLIITINVRVGKYAEPDALPIPIAIHVLPSIPRFSSYFASIVATLQIIPIPIRLKDAIKAVAERLFGGKVDSFYNVDRELKTVVNFGQDFQPLVTNWMYDPTDDTKTKFLVKLYKPLPDEVETKTQVWISRELAAPIVDRIFINVIPATPQKVYLRPANKNISIDGRSGTGVSGVTMTKLFTTGAFDPIRPTDPVMEEWFTGDIGSAELNVDYSDYRNFVFFGSAGARLNAFANKMSTLQNLDTLIGAQSASISASGQGVTSSLAYPAVTKYAQQRLDVIQSFDPYERFLYYDSGSAYSSSLNTNHPQDAIYVNSDATWPKVNGVVKTATQVVGASWWNSQLAIATDYDTANQNYLVSNLPEYLRRDENSAEFLTFVNLIGHQFDTMKLYIDHMSDMYDRDNDPSVGMSQDLVWNIAQSYGIDLPNQYAIKNLTDYTIGQVGIPSAKIYHEVAAETWKRFLHNQIFMMKTKGTKTSLRALCNAYGILPSLLQIRESAMPGALTPSKTFEVYEEQTNSLSILQNSFLTIPWSTLPAPAQTVQLRFATTRTNEAVLLDASGSWALKIIPEAKTNATASISATATGYQRVSGSFISDGFIIGQMVQAAGFATSPVGQILNVTATNLTVSSAPAVTSSLVGRSVFTVGTKAKLQLVTPLSASVSSSLFNLCGGDYYTAMVRYSGSVMELQVKRAEQDQIIEASITKGTTGAVASVFNTPTTLRIGASGSVFGTAFEGVIDEGRVWSEYSTDSSFDLFTKYPGLYSGNSTVSARDNLLVRLSFNKSKNLFGTSFLPNESPYIKAHGVNLTGSLAQIVTSNFPNVPSYPNNMVITTREVARYTPNAASVFTTNKVIIAAPSPRSYAQGTNIPVLYRDKSVVPLSDKKEQGASNNTIGFYFSLTDAINDNIIRSIGNIDLNNYLGDPAELTSSSYSALMTLDNIYWTNYAYNFNVNTFIDFVDNLLEPLFKQARQLVPARAKLLSGIVHEPHILERSKIPQKKIKVSAGQYSRSNQTQNLEANLIDVTPDLPKVNLENYDNLIRLQKTMMLSSSLNRLSASISNVTRLVIRSETESAFSASYSLSNTQHIKSRYVVLDDYTNLIGMQQNMLQFFGLTDAQQLSPSQLNRFRQLQLSFRAADISVASTIEERSTRIPVVTYNEDTTLISPFSDFLDIGSYTYFNNPYGFVLSSTMIQTRVHQNVLVDRGTWQQGRTYSRNDFVIQLGVSGAGGNNNEYVCISPDRTFTSTNPPYIDTQNWKAMEYIPVEVDILKKAIMVNGKISLIDSNSPLTPFVGYAPQHIKFSRDMRRGIINHQWLGCLQTDLTTTDGKPVVEVTAAVGDILVVRNPGEPIQPSQNQSGPILNVE